MIRIFLLVAFSVALIGCASTLSHPDYSKSNHNFYIECDSSLTVRQFQLSRIDTLPFVTGKMINNKLHDRFIALNSLRDTMVIMSFNEGKKNGTAKLWYMSSNANGKHQLKLSVNYSNDTIVGEKTSWFPDGTLRAKYIYQNGALVSSEVYESETGKKFPKYLAARQAIIDEDLDNKFYQSYLDMIFAKKAICKEFK